MPTPLSSDGVLSDCLSEAELKTIKGLTCFVVEDLRTARRFLSQAGWRGRIEELELYELSEHTSSQQAESLVHLLDDGRSVGLLSEAGLPAVADPGAALIAKCHTEGIRVVPFSGPSSLMLALMSSGLNGQSFAFCGYLPAKTPQRRKAICEVEKTSVRLNQSQIFIETPYRNDSMLADLLECCKDDTKLCIAMDITSGDEMIRTKTIGQWKKQIPQLGKRPCVFILYA